MRELLSAALAFVAFVLLAVGGLEHPAWAGGREPTEVGPGNPPGPPFEDCVRGFLGALKGYWCFVDETLGLRPRPVVSGEGPGYPSSPPASCIVGLASVLVGVVVAFSSSAGISLHMAMQRSQM